MDRNFDFEQAWQEKLSRALDQARGVETRQAIMSGGHALSDRSDRADVILWTREVVERSESLLSSSQRAQAFSACACRYPDEQLESLRATYAADGNLDQILDELHQRFVTFLREDLALTQDEIDQVVARGWGMAGRREGKTITVTKIPKSGYLRAYLAESDPEVQRAMYCHCPRVRDAVAAGTLIPATYCHCGAGFYKALWETILDQPVQVEVVSSVLAGDDTCTVAIHLP